MATRARETRVWHPVIMRSGKSISGVNPTGARARTAVDVIAIVHETNPEKINPIRLAEP